MVRKLCVTIPEEMDIVIDRLCDLISKQNNVKVSKSKVVTLILDTGLQVLIPQKQEKGEPDGH